jgi:hypothetical protein
LSGIDKSKESDYENCGPSKKKLRVEDAESDTASRSEATSSLSDAVSDKDYILSEDDENEKVEALANQNLLQKNVYDVLSQKGLLEWLTDTYGGKCTQTLATTIQKRVKL